MRSAAMSVTRQLKRMHVVGGGGDGDSVMLSAAGTSERAKSPLSPRTSTAPSVSTCSIIMDQLSVRGDNSGNKEGPLVTGRRKSFISLQLHRRSKLLGAKESPLLECVGWEQAWQYLQRIAGNPECIDLIMRNLNRSYTQLDDTLLVGKEQEVLDSHLGGLLHQLLLTSLGEFQSATPSYQKTHRRQLIGLLVSLVQFCCLCLRKSGGSRQFAVLSTLNKVLHTNSDLMWGIREG